MPKNVGTADRVIRVIVGLVAAVLGFTVSPWFYVITVLALFTAMAGWCFVYAMFGMSTCKTNTPPPVGPVTPPTV